MPHQIFPDLFALPLRALASAKAVRLHACDGSHPAVVRSRPESRPRRCRSGRIAQRSAATLPRATTHARASRRQPGLAPTVERAPFFFSAATRSACGELTLRAPRVAMAWDRPVNTYSAGWLRYLLEQRVAEGAMGMVFRATHLQVGSTVAVKLMRPQREGLRQRVRLGRPVSHGTGAPRHARRRSERP